MLLPRHAFSNPFVFSQFLQVISRSDRPVVEIDGYPEHETKIEQLDAKERQKIVALAIRIVESHKTSQPIVAFTVRGHADVALRKAPGERAAFEQQTSERRAESARNVLLSEMIKLPRGGSIAAAMPFLTEGAGSRERRHVPAAKHALTLREMEANRRVEFFIGQFDRPPVRPPAPPPAPRPPEVGSRWRIQIKSGLTVGTALPPPADDLTGGNTTLFVEITDLDRKRVGRFRANVTGAVLPSISLGSVPTPVTSESYTEGAPVDFRTTGGVTLEDFAGDVDIAQDPGAGVSVLSKGGNFAFSLSALDSRRVTTVPSVVSVPAGSPALTLPKASLGFAGTGTLKLRDAPRAAP